MENTDDGRCWYSSFFFSRKRKARGRADDVFHGTEKIHKFEQFSPLQKKIVEYTKIMDLNTSITYALQRVRRFK